MIITPHKRPFTYSIIQEYASQGLDPTKIELLCLFDPAGNLYDASGNERHGTINNSIFTGQGRYGIGMFFDGIDDYVDFGNILGFSPSTTPFSISTWINKVDTAAGRAVIGKKNSAGNGEGWAVRVQANEKARFTIVDINGDVIRRDTTTALSSGEFNHIVTTYDGSQVGAGINLYLNGVLDQDAGVGIVLDNDISNAISLQAGIQDTVASPLPGIVDNIMIYSDILNVPQVQNLFNAGL